jgi:DNA-binding transcriptional ArsR family regulator
VEKGIVCIPAYVQISLRTEDKMEQKEKINAPPLALSASIAKPLANPWRNRILAELLLRPMSPKEFTRQVGGPSLPTIARYFRELRLWGFLEVAEERRGGQRRGAVEKVYRAIQRIHFETSTWEQLPRYLRSECSHSMMGGLITRITEAVEAGTFDTEKDRHLSWKTVRLDRLAWREYSRHLDGVLAEIEPLEVESAARIRSEADSLLATVGLISFRSPAAECTRLKGVSCASNEERPHFLMSARTAKALANPWRNRILAELHTRPMSPKQFLEEIGGPDLPTVARYFRQLKAWGYLEVLEELKGGNRRGSVEKVYQAIRRVHFNTPTWEQLPLEARSACSVSMLDGLMTRLNDAIAADTLDAEVDRFLCWKTVNLDRQAWQQLGRVLDGSLALVQSLERSSIERIEEGAEEIPATIALLAFRSPEVLRT